MGVPVTSRIKVLDTPVMAPGICSLCGSSGDGKRKFIDFGKQLDWYGAIYFCSECIREVAQSIDYIHISDFNLLHDKLRKSIIKFDQLQEEHRIIKDVLSKLLSNCTCNSDSPDDSSDVVSISISESEDIEESNSETVGGDSKIDESSGIEGSDDLFDSSDFE